MTMTRNDDDFMNPVGWDSDGYPESRLALLSIGEAADVSRFSASAIQTAIEAGHLPACKILGGRQFLVRRGDLDRWLGGVKPEPSLTEANSRSTQLTK